MLIIRRGRGGEVVGSLQSGSSAPESSVGRGYCAVSLDKTWLVPSRLHAARGTARDAGGDGKGEFLPTHLALRS